MSLIIAQQLIRRLRSNGVKVFLRPRGGDAPPEVAFAGLDAVPVELRRKLEEHGKFIRLQLEDEALVRAARAAAKRIPVERSRIKDAPVELL